MKQKKQAHLPQERLGKRIPPKRILCHQQKAILNLNPKNLSLQRIKRINATELNFSSQRWESAPREVCKPLIQTQIFEKKAQKLFVDLPVSFKDQDYFQLAHSLKRFKSLKRITLDCSFCNITDKGLYALMKGLRGLCYLKEISLNFSHWDDITDTGLEYASQTLKRMFLLEDIDLDFSFLSPHVTTEGFLKSNGSLNRLKRLKNVTFKTPECEEMTDNNLMDISFKRLVALQTVYLSFASCPQLTDIGLDLMTKSLKGLASLQRVKLDFFECPGFGDLGLHCIWEMMNCLASLKEITLEFSECLKITDAGFYDMNETLKCLDSIQKIYLDFYLCSEITDSSIGYLCKTLGKSTSLKSLYVGFADSKKITDVGLKKLIDCINKLPHLQDIGLDFIGCTQLTNTSLKNVVHFLQSLDGPKKITLGFALLERTTDEERDDFGEKIENIQRQRKDFKIEFRPV